MLPLILYLAAALITGAHVYILLSLAVFGAPSHALELVSLVGSVGLVVAGYISLWKPHVAAKVALLSSLAIWCFYAPSIRATISTVRNSQFSHLQTATLPYLSVTFLTLVTMYSAVVTASKTRPSGRWSRLFPEGSGRYVRMAVGVCTAATVIGVGAWLTFSAKKSTRHPSRFLIPAGYVGWVRVEFDVSGAPPAPFAEGQYIFKIPSSGLLRTSSGEQYGWGKDQYYFYSEKGLSMLPTGRDEGRLVWGQMNGEERGSAGRQEYQQFFVGTEQQFKEQAGVNGSKPSRE